MGVCRGCGTGFRLKLARRREVRGGQVQTGQRDRRLLAAGANSGWLAFTIESPQFTTKEKVQPALATRAWRRR